MVEIRRRERKKRAPSDSEGASRRRPPLSVLGSEGRDSVGLLYVTLPDPPTPIMTASSSAARVTSRSSRERDLMVSMYRRPSAGQTPTLGTGDGDGGRGSYMARSGR